MSIFIKSEPLPIQRSESPWRARCRVVIAAFVFLAATTNTAVSQSAAPVVAAFRESARNVGERIRLAADAMPAGQYNSRVTPTLPTFGDTVFQLGLVTDDICSRLGRVPRPVRSAVSSTSSKTSLVERVAEAFQFCEQVMASVPDSDLANPVWFTFRQGPLPAPSMPRAEAVMLVTAYWADAYAQLATSLRLIGRVPPEVCRGGDKVDWNLNPLCDSGFVICRDVGGGRPGLTLSLSDSSYAITSDGKGPYRSAGNVRVVAQRPVGLLMFASPAADSASHRSIRLDLRHPVPGGIGVPLGIVVADRDVELSAKYYAEPDKTAHSVLEIPIGTTVEAPQMNVGFRIDGRPYALQMGPQPYGHCYSDGTAIHGTGTTPGTIQREADDRWIVDLPPRSIGRLFDNTLGDPNAVDRGLYVHLAAFRGCNRQITCTCTRRRS